MGPVDDTNREIGGCAVAFVCEISLLLVIDRPISFA